MNKEIIEKELIDLSNSVLRFKDHKGHADTNDCQYCNLSESLFKLSNIIKYGIVLD